MPCCRNEIIQMGKWTRQGTPFIISWKRTSDDVNNVNVTWSRKKTLLLREVGPPAFECDPATLQFVGVVSDTQETLPFSIRWVMFHEQRLRNPKGITILGKEVHDASKGAWDSGFSRWPFSNECRSYWRILLQNSLHKEWVTIAANSLVIVQLLPIHWSCIF